MSSAAAESACAAWLYFPTSYFNVLENACAGPDEGRIFIDRDPRWFHLILNYLRDGRCVMPTDEAALREILYEADFYQVSPLAPPHLDTPHEGRLARLWA